MSLLFEYNLAQRIQSIGKIECSVLLRIISVLSLNELQTCCQLYLVSKVTGAGAKKTERPRETDREYDIKT